MLISVLVNTRPSLSAMMRDPVISPLTLRGTPKSARAPASSSPRRYCSGIRIDGSARTSGTQTGPRGERSLAVGAGGESATPGDRLERSVRQPTPQAGKRAAKKGEHSVDDASPGLGLPPALLRLAE